MDVLHQRCCGVDVHKASVVACLLVAEEGHVPHKEVRTFGTMTEDLLGLVDLWWTPLSRQQNGRL
jgi:hypothetical protein